MRRFLNDRKTIKALMFTLYHHPFCPHSRFIRLAMGEYGLDLRLVEERAWDRRGALLAPNPAGSPPGRNARGPPPLPRPGGLLRKLHRGPAGAAGATPPPAATKGGGG